MQTGGSFAVGQLRVGNFVFRIGREICHRYSVVVREEGVGQKPPSKLRHASGVEANLTLIPGGEGRMGLLRIVTGSLRLTPCDHLAMRRFRVYQSPIHHCLSGTVGDILHVFLAPPANFQIPHRLLDTA